MPTVNLARMVTKVQAVHKVPKAVLALKVKTVPKVQQVPSVFQADPVTWVHQALQEQLVPKDSQVKLVDQVPKVPEVM